MLKIYLLGSILVSLISLMASQLNYRDIYTSSLTCRMGRLQSPINLSDKYSSYNATTYPVYFNYVPLTNAFLDWSADGRILSVKQSTPLTNWGYMGFTRGGVLKQYALTGIEINFPAEHLIEGALAEAEVKLIHEKILSFETTVNQYRKMPDANTKLVISLLYSFSANNTDNGFMSQMLGTLPASYRNGALNYGNSQTLNLNTYGLFTNRQFYFYDGAFTAEPCDEIVNYVVIKDNFFLSAQAKSVLTSAYSKYQNSIASKSVSEYYGRNVTRNYMNVTEASAGFLAFNLLVSIFIFFILF
jgi:carbonic anhydrase